MHFYVLTGGRLLRKWTVHFFLHEYREITMVTVTVYIHRLVQGLYYYYQLISNFQLPHTHTRVRAHAHTHTHPCIYPRTHTHLGQHNIMIWILIWQTIIIKFPLTFVIFSYCLCGRVLPLANLDGLFICFEGQPT